MTTHDISEPIHISPAGETLSDPARMIRYGAARIAQGMAAIGEGVVMILAGMV